MGAIAHRMNDVLARLWRWTKGHIIQTVPEDIALCEFSCNKTQCTLGEWQNCERRIHNAAGELTPLRAPVAASPSKAASLTNPARPDVVANPRAHHYSESLPRV